MEWIFDLSANNLEIHTLGHIGRDPYGHIWALGSSARPPVRRSGVSLSISNLYCSPSLDN